MKELKGLCDGMSLLYVEDEPELRQSVSDFLKKIFPRVASAENGQIGLQKYQEHPYDIVLTDILMPLMNGIEMTQHIKAITEDQEIIIMSAYSEPEYFTESIRLGVNGYVIKPVNFEQITTTLLRSVKKLRRFKENRRYKEHLEEMVQERTRELLELEKDKITNFEHTLMAFVELIEDRDTYTGGHSQRVAKYSRMLAETMGCTKDECELIYRAGVLHDIGKIATPDTILLKPGKLNALEYKLIQEHVNVGYTLLSKIPMYKEMADIIAHHHERFDGNGYPQGLKAQEIPYLSRIMIVADAFDAMTTNRIYKGRKSIPEAISEIVSLRGVQFEPEVVDAAENVFTTITEIEFSSQIPTTDIEKERFSYFYRDQVTQTYNVEYLNFILNRNAFDASYKHLHVLFLHNFNSYNHKHGWSAGDTLLQHIAAIIHGQFPSALLFRIHGDDFVLVSETELNIDMEHFKQRLPLQQDNLMLSHQHIAIAQQQITNLQKLEQLLIDNKHAKEELHEP